MMLETLSLAPDTALPPAEATDDAEALAPEMAPEAEALTPDTLALADAVMPTELDSDEMAPPSRIELEAEGAEMVVDSEPETDWP